MMIFFFRCMLTAAKNSVLSALFWDSDLGSLKPHGYWLWRKNTMRICKSFHSNIWIERKSQEFVGKNMPLFSFILVKLVSCRSWHFFFIRNIWSTYIWTGWVHYVKVFYLKKKNLRSPLHLFKKGVKNCWGGGSLRWPPLCNPSQLSPAPFMYVLKLWITFLELRG